MGGASYKPSAFTCGTCGGELDFVVRGGCFPGAWYVHRADRRFRCHGRRWFGSSTNSAPLGLPTRTSTRQGKR